MENAKKLLTRSIELCIFLIIFIVPLSFWIPAYEAFEMPKSTNFYVLIYLAAGLSLIKMAMEKSFVFKWTTFSFSAGALAVAYILSFFQALFINVQSAAIHWQFLKMLLLSIFFYFLIINTFNRSQIYKLLYFIIVSHFIIVLYGIMQYFGFDFIKWVSFGEGRVYSTMGNPDYMAAQFSILIPIILVFLISSFGKLIKFFLSLLLFGMFFLIIVSHGRGAWLGFLGSLAYLFIILGIFYGRQFFAKHKTFLASIIIFIIFLAAIFTIPNPLNRNPITDRIKQGLSMTSDSVAVRLFYWESALQMAKHYPLFGMGVGGFSMNTSYYQRKVLDRWNIAAPDMAARVAPHVELYTHNDYLQTLAETGIFGFGIFILLFSSILVISVKKARDEKNAVFKNILIGITGAVVAFLINALLNFPWRVFPTLILLWSIFSLLSLNENRNGVKFNIPAPIIYYIIIPLLIIASVIEIKSFLANSYIKYSQGLFASAMSEQDQLKKKTLSEAAREGFDKAVASFPRATDTIELCLYTGNAYNALGDVKTAIGYYNRGISIFPNFIESHYNIANVYMNNNMTEQAIIEYNKVLDLNPKYSNALNNLANIYFNRGEYAKSIDMYSKAVGFDPKNADARYNLAATYFRLNKYKEAVVELRTILEFKPDYQLAIEWLDKMKKAGLTK